MFEKYPKGQKDFSTILQKARASGAEALVPTSYEGDLISMTRQMKQLDINFPYVFMVYASTPQFQAIGADADYIYSHTNYHPAINWKVNAGLTREQFATSYDRLFPKAEFPPDFQTALAYGAGALTEEIVKQAGNTDAAALKKASLDLSGKLTVMAGPYAIDETGKQLQMPFPSCSCCRASRWRPSGLRTWPPPSRSTPCLPGTSADRAHRAGPLRARPAHQPEENMSDIAFATLSELALGLAEDATARWSWRSTSWTASTAPIRRCTPM